MREIVLDTETTGLSPEAGHRIVELGCLELVNHVPTGRTFHRYLNPERDVPREAYEVHGLSSDFLADKPLFAEVADDFAAFLEDAALVVHNAPFDLGFLNAELSALGREALSEQRVVDTLVLARRRHPAASNSLDALCRRYSIDNSRRDKHGALLDSELLAEVYIELIGGRQPHLTLISQGGEETASGTGPSIPRRARALAPRLSAGERAAHRAFLESFRETTLWAEFGIAAESAGEDG